MLMQHVVNLSTQSVIFGVSLEAPGQRWRRRQVFGCCPHLSSIQSHISQRHVPSPPRWERFEHFKTNLIQQQRRARGRHAAGAPLRGGEGDYGGLRPSLILHFFLPSAPSLAPDESSTQEKFSSSNLHLYRSNPCGDTVVLSFLSDVNTIGNDFPTDQTSELRLYLYLVGPVVFTSVLFCRRVKQKVTFLSCVFGFCQTSCNEEVWVSCNLIKVHFGIYIHRGWREEKGAVTLNGS